MGLAPLVGLTSITLHKTSLTLDRCFSYERAKTDGDVSEGEGHHPPMSMSFFLT